MASPQSKRFDIYISLSPQHHMTTCLGCQEVVLPKKICAGCSSGACSDCEKDSGFEGAGGWLCLLCFKDLTPSPTIANAKRPVNRRISFDEEPAEAAEEGEDFDPSQKNPANLVPPFTQAFHSDPKHGPVRPKIAVPSYVDMLRHDSTTRLLLPYCTRCEKNSVSTVLVECGHAIWCIECARRPISKCPLCSVEIKSIIPIVTVRPE